MRPFVQHPLVELVGQSTLLRDIGLVQHLVIDLVRLRILVVAVILAADRVRQPGLDIDHRVDDAVAIAAGGHLEIATAQSSEPRTGRDDALRDMQADLAPLVDQPDPEVFVRLIDVAVKEFEAEPFSAGLFQQPLRLGPRLVDVGPEAGDRFDLLLALGASGEPGKMRPPTVCIRLTLERPGCAAPAVERQHQGAPNPDVVERLLLVVDPGSYRAVPVALLDDDLVAERLLQLVHRRRRIATKLGGRLVGADRVELRRLLRRVNAIEAVQIRQPLVVVIGVAHPGDLLAGFVAGELERPGPQDVVLVPVDVLVEHLLLVDPVVRVGECRQKCAGGELQVNDDGVLGPAPRVLSTIMKLVERGLNVPCGGKAILLRLAATSSAVSLSPLWNLTSSRILKV